MGVVLPLGISTASAGLFQKDYLNLPLPSPEQPPKPLNRVLLIWGGSSSVGSCAIQLAKAAGAIIITTASPKNFEYVKALGAEEVFDYRAEDVEDQIVNWLQSKTVLGAFHARGGNGAVQTCARIVDRSQGKAIVVSVRGIPPPGDGGGDVPKAVRTKTSKLCLVPLVIYRTFSQKRGNELTAVDYLLCSFCFGHLRSWERGWTVYLEGLLACSSEVANDRSSPRSFDCGRAVALSTTWS